jgi:oligosaccharide repeat unit polymerase
LAVSGVSYSEFKSARAGVDAYPWFLFAYSTSMPLLAAVAKKQYKWPLIALCAVPAFILLITGNRGEVLYSLAATFAILGLRNVRVSLPIVSVALLIFFLMVPLIREFRSIGIRSFTFQQSALSTFDPFLELGFQLRPLEITVGWIEGGEAHAQGGTYLLPLQRIAGRLSLMQAPELEGNRMDVQNRTPGLGYNVIAEAFFNFGAIGVAAVMGLLGYLMAFFSQRSTSLTQLGLYGVITAILLNSLRNSFLFVPGQLLVLSVLFAAAWYARPYFAMFHGFVEE